MIINGYIDDSGSDNKNPDDFFVLAGYVLPADDWINFSEKWDSELKIRPAVKCFKMSDAEYGDGYFKGMSEEFRRLKVNEMAEIIPPFKPIALSCSLNWGLYNKIIRGRVPAEVDDPYAVLFYAIIRLMYEWQLDAGGDTYQKVDFYFDEQHIDQLKILAGYLRLKRNIGEPYHNMLGQTPAFRDDEELNPLQAADMLAWHVHRDLVKPEEGRPLLKKIAGEHYVHLPMEQEDMERFVIAVRK